MRAHLRARLLQRRGWAAPLAMLAVAFAPATAHGETDAEAHFRQGLADMLAGRYETGCPALAKSFAAEPLPGTLFTLAECEAQRGRLASAVAHYEAYLTLFAELPAEKKAKQKGREGLAQAKKELLGPLVPRLTITLPKHAPRGTVVRRDGEEVSPGQLGQALFVDPGEHVISAEAPGRERRALHVELERGERKAVTIEIDPDPAEVSKSLKEADAHPPPLADSQVDLGRRARRIGAYVSSGLGVAGLFAGGVAGALALGENGTVSSNCGEPVNDVVTCKPEGKAAAERGRAFGTASTIGVSVGLAMLGAGAVLYLTSRPTAGATARVPAAWLSVRVAASSSSGMGELEATW